MLMSKQVIEQPITFRPKQMRRVEIPQEMEPAMRSAYEGMGDYWTSLSHKGQGKPTPHGSSKEGAKDPSK